MESAGAVRQAGRAIGGNAVLLLRRHLAEGLGIAGRLEDRVVAEAGRPARRIDDCAEDAALEQFLMPIRPGDHQRRDEMRLALFRHGRAALGEFGLHTGQSRGEVLARTGPVRREQAGRAVERVDADAGIVGQRRQAGSVGRRHRLDRGVLGEHVAVLLGLGQAELAGRDQLDAIGGHQLAHLAQFALVMGRDHDLAGEGTVGHCH